MTKPLSQGQRSLIMFWVVVVLAAEIIMFVFNQHLPRIYLVVALLFTGGFALRIVNRYPGKKEPLILDFSGIVIALLFTYLATLLAVSNIRFVLILCSSLIILPHIIYIISNEKR